MSTSAGRRSAAYRRAAAEYRTGRYPCWLHLPGCTGAGTTVDHDPPLARFPTPDLWHGTYRPACSHCQSIQGNRLRHDQTTGWTW
jgi:hypothetical protein